MAITTKISIPKNKPPRSYKEKSIESFGKLGTKIVVSPKSHISVNSPGYSLKYYIPTVEVVIGVGSEYTAHLIMDIDAWEALNKGAKVDITTSEGFKKQYVYPIKNVVSKIKKSGRKKK